MKNKLSILLICCLIGFSINAQEYFPKGAIWHYEIPAGFSWPISYTTFEVVNDTIFNGDTLKQITGNQACSPIGTILLKQIGQKIYLLNECDSSYTLFYDFSVSVGDTVHMPMDICGVFSDTLSYVIDSINPININGNILNHYFIRDIDPWGSNYFLGFDIIEGIGSTYFFLPQMGACDPHYGPLRCYEDTIIGYYNTGIRNTCDTIIFVGIEENILNQSTSIFPNPNYGRVYIEAENKINNIEIYSLSGQKLLATKNKEIDLFSFSKGIYLLKIYFEKGIVYRKVVKE